jgi:hypothetical protein
VNYSRVQPIRSKLTSLLRETFKPVHSSNGRSKKTGSDIYPPPNCPYILPRFSPSSLKTSAHACCVTHSNCQIAGLTRLHLLIGMIRTNHRACHCAVSKSLQPHSSLDKYLALTIHLPAAPSIHYGPHCILPFRCIVKLLHMSAYTRSFMQIRKSTRTTVNHTKSVASLYTILPRG